MADLTLVDDLGQDSPGHAPQRSPFNRIRRVRRDGSEFWDARELMVLLGYAQCQNFQVPLTRAMTTAANLGHVVDGLFMGSHEKSHLGRPRANFELSRFAAFLVSMNGRHRSMATVTPTSVRWQLPLSPTDPDPPHLMKAKHLMSSQTLERSRTAPRLKASRADMSLFTFYDIESLNNVFSVVAYTPRPGTLRDHIEIFHLVDDAALADQLTADTTAARRAIRAGNPGLPASAAVFHDLRTVSGLLRLAKLIGLSDIEPGQPHIRSSYNKDLSLHRDTDPGHDPVAHPFLAGYNSTNYDITMLALFLSETFEPSLSHRRKLEKLQVAVAAAETAERKMHTGEELRDHTLQVPVLTPPSAAMMRAHNDRLFSADHIQFMPGYLGWNSPAAEIRRAMLNSGRHLDVARLNEVQQKVGLKRLLGMLGHQIKESDRLTHNSTIATLDELHELLAYNVADCLGLAQLFAHPVYSSAFDLKAALLSQYSECVFHPSGQVRRDRLSIDASSAKFVGRILAPDKPLSDIRAVSFEYPHPEVARQTNTTPVNVLDECVKFFEAEVAPERDTNPVQAGAHQQFMEVVAYYRSIEGRNFNDSDEYTELYGDVPAKDLKQIPKAANNVPYFLPGGEPSSCFATFSTGGIHGAEADLESFATDRAAYEAEVAMLARARQVFPDPCQLVAVAKEQHNMLRLPDRTHVDKRLVLLGSDPAKVRYRKPKKGDHAQNEQLARAQTLVPDPADLLATQRPESEALVVHLSDGTALFGKVVLDKATATGATYRQKPSRREPQLFVTKDDGSTKLHPKFVRTSAGMVIHEDFTSYYPNLLRNMRAFWNPDLGEDRYASIFFQKEELGAQLKQPGLSQAERDRLTTLRNGTKLILNAASGAGDASHRNPIRMNNTIISMRLLGQMFSWRVGQAQTLAGARIISTNTDGLYSIPDNAETNNRVLAEQAALIGVDIEPEPMFLISKDSNNRLELLPPRGQSFDTPVEQWQIHSAGGGTLACHGGPTPTKSLAHPAVIDHALARYLQIVTARGGQAALAEPFDAELGGSIIEQARDLGDPVGTARLFQNVIAASRSSITYPFAAAPIGAVGEPAPTPTGLKDQTDSQTQTGSQNQSPVEDSTLIREPVALQMVNRVFVVRSGTPGAVSLHNAGAWKVPPASLAKRNSGEQPKPVADPVAAEILRHHGFAVTAKQAHLEKLTLVAEDQDVVVRKINSIDPTWPMLICNDDLAAMPATELTAILGALDLDIYVQMLDETFTKNWRNATP